MMVELIILNNHLMNRCHSCRNTRRQLLMLKCSHDTCIKCAADNYFINCKNKPNTKKPPKNTYYCEKCLQQTELDCNTIQTLRKYFMDNVAIDQNNKKERREKIAERQVQQRERKERVARLDHQNTQRPKSLQIQIADRKRTLSKYLNQKQVQKFMEMQNQYGSKNKEVKQPKLQQRPSITPKPHQFTNNQYQLRMEAESKRQREHQHKERKSINDSFQKFAEQQRYRTENAPLGRNSQRALEFQQVEYEIYHNGKGVANPIPRGADRYLVEEEKGRSSRPSSNSSNKVVGTIRSKKSPSRPDHPSPTPTRQEQRTVTGVLIKKQRVASCKSEDNLEQLHQRAKMLSTEYNTRNQENTHDWEMESKETKRQEKTLQHGERNSTDTVQKILQTFEASNHQQQRSPQMMKQKSILVDVRGSSPQRGQRVATYFCKIHEDQQIIYFCLKCNQLICSQCALHGSHRSHEIHSLKKSALLLRQKLAHSTGTLTKLLIQQQSKEKILKQCIHQIGLQCARQKEQVRSSFQNFIFHVDKKYKDLLKDVQDRFSSLLADYGQRLNQARNNYLQVSKVKDCIQDTLQACAGPQEATASQTSIGAACNQFGNFTLKRPQPRPGTSSGIQCINRLTRSIQELEEFLKSSNVLLFSSKKESLLSDNSSLRLSDSSNLLEQKETHFTPETVTPQAQSLGQSLFKRGSPDKRNKKIVVSSYSLNVKSRIKISQCDCIVDSLHQMQEIIKAIKPDSIDYQLRALQ